MSVAIIGIGKLGLCFALFLSELGFEVIGVDVNEEYVKKLNDKTIESNEPCLIETLKSSKNFEATTDLGYALNNSKFVFVLVQTPETENSYDHDILLKVLEDIDEKSNGEIKHIVINSTVMPGFYRKLKKMKNTISYNPAFVAQGTVLSDYRNGGKFGVSVIGTYEDEVFNFMKQVFPNIKRITPESAEIFKIADNTFRVLKITYANMVGDICDRTQGACKKEVSELLKDDISIGNLCMTPGYCYGGPCYPRDLRALTTYVDECNMDSALLKGVYLTNENHHQVMLEDLLKQNKDEYMFDSLTYRPGMKVDLKDNSHPLRLANELKKLGKKVHNILSQ